MDELTKDERRLIFKEGRDGYRAAKQMATYYPCPYIVRTKRWEIWWDGYDSARDEDESRYE